MTTPAFTGDRYAIGVEVVCTDEACGKVAQVVVDPVARRLTHLVVTPKGLGDPRLVPIALVSEAGDEVHLSCTKAEFEQLEPAAEVRFLSDRFPDMGYGLGELLSWPYYGLGGTEPIGIGAQVSPAGITSAAEVDRLPRGEVGIERGGAIHSADGDIGRVQGLVIDPKDEHVTHLLVEEGRLWGKKQVAIPVARVTGFDDDGAHVNLTSDQIRQLPPLDLAPD